MKASTLKLLEEAQAFGFKMAGHGYSTAKLIKKALENENNPAILD